MSEPVKSVPDGYHAVTPYLIVKGAAAALAFYAKAFGAKELLRMDGPGGRIMHCEFQIGDSRVMMADENPEQGIVAPPTLGGSPVGLCVYIEAVDRVFANAIAAGAKSLRPVKDQFYGDRSGTLEDPFGHKWTIATHVEDLSPEEMCRRATAGAA